MCAAVAVNSQLKFNGTVKNIGIFFSIHKTRVERSRSKRVMEKKEICATKEPIGGEPKQKEI